MQNPMPIPVVERSQSSDAALKCYGTAYIFEKRAAAIRWKIQALTFLGIAVPAALGSVVASFSMKAEALGVLIGIAGVLGTFQLVLSVWSLVAHWDDRLSYFIESKSANYRLSEDWLKLAQATIPDNEFSLRHAVLDTASENRADLDNRIDVSDKEKRRGMRAGLWKFQRACAGCNGTSSPRAPRQWRASRVRQRSRGPHCVSMMASCGVRRGSSGSS
ncbi:MAG: hypothetical protein K8T90_10350 [Planctomycetes bacterium]|nr:hypothetical protein [Planctomycetota bacterium]